MMCITASHLQAVDKRVTSAGAHPTMRAAVDNLPGIRVLAHRLSLGACQLPSCRTAAKSCQLAALTHSAADSSALHKALKQQERATTRAHRFYVHQRLVSLLHSNSVTEPILLEGDEGRHAVRSLRVREGDIIEVCDGQGCLVQASITTVDRPGSRAWAQPTSPVTQVPPPAPNWVLAAACTTLKGGRADWLVEKATELGAGELIPLITTRSQPPGGSSTGGSRAPVKSKYSKKHQASRSGDDGGSSGGGGGDDDYQPGRLERVAIAATKQCLRAHMLKLHAPTHVLDPEFLARVQEAGVSLIAAAGGAPLHQVLEEVQAEVEAQAQGGESEEHTRQTSSSGAGGQGFTGAGVLLVGPEGDWTPDELRALCAAGARPVGLGSLRLRTETAAVALLSAVQMSGLSCNSDT